MTECVHVPHHDVLSELTRERDELKRENEALRDLVIDSHDFIDRQGFPRRAKNILKALEAVKK